VALGTFAEQVVKRRLEQIDGVAQAAVTGAPVREVRVEADPDRLDGLGLSLGDVARAVAAANRSAPSGGVRRGQSRFPLRAMSELATAQELADVPVRVSGGSSAVWLRDVARVVDGVRARES
jgi:HAE1 family hydrophobic/amphiphilic exporter-1